MGSRRSSRTLALDVLYEREVSAAPVEEILRRYRDKPHYEFAATLITGVIEHLDELDVIIAAHARGWSVERMPLIDRTLVRMALFEILELQDIPAAVSINEAVELAKAYSTEDSSRFVNGVLSAALAERDGAQARVEPPR